MRWEKSRSHRSNPQLAQQIDAIVRQIARFLPGLAPKCCQQWHEAIVQRLSPLENYGCIAGYPDGSFRGSRALSRYEFAAGLNACLDTLAEKLASGGVGENDLDSLRRLTEEFRTELATLRGRVDNLEARATELVVAWTINPKLRFTVGYLGQNSESDGRDPVCSDRLPQTYGHPPERHQPS